MSGFAGRMPPPLFSPLFVDLSQRNFVQGLTIKALAQIWKNLHKINDVIDNDVILRKLAEKTVKDSILKSPLLFHLLLNPAETERLTIYVVLIETLRIKIIGVSHVLMTSST